MSWSIVFISIKIFKSLSFSNVLLLNNLFKLLFSIFRGLLCDILLALLVYKKWIIKTNYTRIFFIKVDFLISKDYTFNYIQLKLILNISNLHSHIYVWVWILLTNGTVNNYKKYLIFQIDEIIISSFFISILLSFNLNICLGSAINYINWFLNFFYLKKLLVKHYSMNRINRETVISKLNYKIKNWLVILFFMFDLNKQRIIFNIFSFDNTAQFINLNFKIYFSSRVSTYLSSFKYLSY